MINSSGARIQWSIGDFGITSISSISSNQIGSPITIGQETSLSIRITISINLYRIDSVSNWFDIHLFGHRVVILSSKLLKDRIETIQN